MSHIGDTPEYMMVKETITLDLDLFDDNYKLLRLPMSRVKTLIQWETEDASSVQDDELPF